MSSSAGSSSVERAYSVDSTFSIGSMKKIRKKCLELKEYHPTVYFDLAADGLPMGRLLFELFATKLPLTSENFRALCTGEKGVGETGVKLHYKKTIFHRIFPGFIAQGGNVCVKHRGGRGSSGDTPDCGHGESIYGAAFDDEGWHYRPNRRGLLCMVNG